MIVRPKQFYIVAMMLTLIALSFPLQAMWLYGHGYNEFSAIFNKISFLNWMVIGVLLVGAYLHLKASPWLKGIAPVTIGLVALNNYVVGHYGADYSMGQTVMATMSFSLLFVPLFMPSSRLVLADPKRRWWARAKRYHKRVSATLNPYVGEMVHSHTFDISKTGAFFCLEGASIEGDVPAIGERVRLHLHVNSMKKIRVEAVVVRIAEPDGRYPRGMGLKFVGIDKDQQKSFQKFLQANMDNIL
ncbi:MAG: PilZ domain-containing protein [Bdellovibrionales bacterium]|nr:PilZ domain-containing protein [Bdellovibrionales bacterium]